MSYCRNCGAKLEENVSYCPKCGTPIKPQTTSQPEKHNDQPINYFAIGSVLAVAAIAIIIVALIAVGLIPGIQLPGGPIIGSGHTQTQEITLSDFSAIQASNGFQVQITQSNMYSIKITADDNLFNYILVNKTDSTLAIRLKSNIGVASTTLKAEISMPDLATIQFSGGAVGNAQNINLSHDFTADLSGGARLTMTGQANNLTATQSGGSQLSMHDFRVNNAHIDFSGGSQGTINLGGRLDATLSGGSHLSYTGNPTLGTIETSGGSSISKIN